MLTPVNAVFGNSATDIVQYRYVSRTVKVAAQNSGGWMSLWGAIPAWAQESGQIGIINLNKNLYIFVFFCKKKGAARPKFKRVEVHPLLGVVSAQVIPTNKGSGSYILLWKVNDESHPLAGSKTAIITIQHTALDFWNPPLTDDK